MVTLDARAGKWLLLALVVSLGANMFMGGLLAGRFANRQSEAQLVGGGTPPNPETPQGAILAAAVRRMVAALPDGERAHFEQAFIDRRRDIMRANVAVREAQLALREAMMADPFDRPRLEQASAALRTRNEEQQRVLHTIVIDAAAQLSPQGRQALANWQQIRPGAVRPALQERLERQQERQQDRQQRQPGAPGGTGTNRP